PEVAQAGVSGEEHLYSDFPEIDLSQLDASDFDSAGCFNELPWCCDHSETESSQYSTDDSELFQIIDSENEALLAALTETLDDIQEDDMALAAFRTMEEGDAPNHSYTSPTPSPKPAAPDMGGLPLVPEVDELSLLKKLLLSPSHVPPSCEAQKEGSTRRQGALKSRPQRPCAKVSPDPALSFFSAQSRSCTELHRHLTANAHCPQTKTSCPANKCQGGGRSSEPQSHCTHNEEDSDTSEDSLSSSEAVATPPSSCEDGASEKELHAVVELIRYMHTYCLPPRKLPPREPADGKHHRPSISWQVAADHKHPRATSSEFSILKELLARDLPCDVSKPYRLARPVYASLARPSPPKSAVVPALELEICTEMGKSRAKTALENPVPHPCPKVEFEVKRETGTVEEDMAKPPAQPASGKAGQKQEGTIYAVRRSKRLNPELGHWLSFPDDPPPESAPVLCPAGENFEVEAPAAEVEVSGVDEGESRCQAHQVESQTPSPESPDLREGCEMEESQSCTLLPSSFTSTPFTTLPSLISFLLSSDPAFGKRNFEQVLTVELCGTAGLTPPTTPPYKPAEEDLYKPDIHHELVKEETAIIPCDPEPRPVAAVVDMAASRKLQKKHPERTELYAHLRRAAASPLLPEHQGVLKRPFSRSFGDHDYCQVLKSEASLQRKVLKSWEPQDRAENEHKRRVPDKHYQGLSPVGSNESSWKEGSKQLRDQEIRASLTKHFGLLDSALEDEDMAFCKTPEYDTVFEDSCSEGGSPVEEEEEEEELCTSPLESKLCPRRNPLNKATLHYCSRSRSSSGSSCCRSRSPTYRRAFRYNQEKGRLGEGRVVYIRNLSSSMSSSELKKRFEVFGEIVDCHVLTRNTRGDKYGFITYRCSEHAALSLKNGASLRKRNEPSFQLSYGGLGNFFWTRYTDLDSNAEESSPYPMKSKYETMDFDSLLQEAQRSLHR
uniref:PPARG coactivator 1 beta n=1 Tax=Sphenodon punctatus TaxID=8508 RepID=A0A8D0HUU3_SPHPU